MQHYSLHTAANNNTNSNNDNYDEDDGNSDRSFESEDCINDYSYTNYNKNDKAKNRRESPKF